MSRRFALEQERMLETLIAAGHKPATLTQYAGSPSGTEDWPRYVLAEDGTRLAKFWIECPGFDSDAKVITWRCEYLVPVPTEEKPA